MSQAWSCRGACEPLHACMIFRSTATATLLCAACFGTVICTIQYVVCTLSDVASPSTVICMQSAAHQSYTVHTHYAQSQTGHQPLTSEFETYMPLANPAINMDCWTKYGLIVIYQSIHPQSSISYHIQESFYKVGPGPMPATPLSGTV